MLYSHTEPVIESSSNIKFHPFNHFYPRLSEHLFNANLSPWNNNWSDVFDFTPAGGKHYSLVDDIDEDFVMPVHVMEAEIMKQKT